MEKLALKRLSKVYCRIAPSNIHGVGIFAIKEIPKGVNPFADSYIGQDAILVHKDKINNLQKMLEDYFPTNENKHFIIPAFPNQPIWTNYLNYTDNKDNINIELDDFGIWRTTRLILEGEELLEDPTHHFNTTDGSFKVRYLDKNKNDYLNLRN